MNRRDLNRRIGLGALGLFGSGCAASGQDIGTFLEQAARDTLKDALDPRRIEQALTPRRDGEIVPIKAPDDWTLTAHRYRPAQPRPGRAPVVLAHGLTYSSAFWDLEPGVSFARWLSQRGWDVWAVNWRGCGTSQKWVFRPEKAPDVLVGGALRRVTGGKLNPTGYASLDPKYANWTLDDHIDQDLPSFLRLVRRVTKAPEVNWVGHSMGGIIPLCHLAKNANPGIARLATVGSQVTMHDKQLVVPFLQQMVTCRELQLTGTPLSEEIAGRAQTSVQNLFFNTRHVSRSVYEALASERTDIPSMGLMKQYMALSEEGVLRDASRRTNYAKAIRNVQVPILVTCGQNDAFAPPSVQKYVYDNVGSTDKTAVVFGRARGFAADSGHDDALVGLTSMREVYPVIERWLLGEKV